MSNYQMDVEIKHPMQHPSTSSVVTRKYHSTYMLYSWLEKKQKQIEKKSYWLKCKQEQN